MSNAFEVTPDDVLNVVHRMGIKISGDDQCREIFNALTHVLIECAALKAGNTLGEQTDAAYQEIRRQIKEKGLL